MTIHRDMFKSDDGSGKKPEESTKEDNMENDQGTKLMTRDAEELLNEAISEAMAIEGEDAVFNFLKAWVQGRAVKCTT